MDNDDKRIKQLSIKELFENTDNYIIPMYQRNYAWDEGEITQLIQDIIDYVPDKKYHYYIGSLVVFEREPNLFEVIDGQQRLTTLSLLLAYLKKEKANKENTSDWSWYNKDNQKRKLLYESRDYSRETFDAIFDGKEPAELKHDTIAHGYKLISEIFPKKLNESESKMDSFTEFLLKNVQIIRILVPEQTDLNHYFEIMNSRGEQLEKHEVLKAELMATLNNGITNDDEKKNALHCLHVIWEACSNMEKYVQQGFDTPEVRSEIFGDNWDEFKAENFDNVSKIISKTIDKNESQNNPQRLTIIISNISIKQNSKIENEKDALDRFHSVINFPNFLLQVLCVTTYEDENIEKVPLDDKKLIGLFKTHLLGQEENDVDKVNKVKKFIFDLLKCKYLFDRYVIKRDFLNNQEGFWSLKRYKKIGSENKGNFINTFETSEQDNGVGKSNNSILMILAAFHISTPTMNYKYWLNAALHFLFENNGNIDAGPYIERMESVARCFVFDRYLANKGEGMNYYDIIYKNFGRCKSNKAEFDNECLKERLSYGNIENNLIFNYLDYLLWRNDQKRQEPKFGGFKFSPRSSVEHLSPQTPFNGKPPDNCNSFGNLCLISHSRNSTLNNRSPEEKKEYYKLNGIIDSIKQKLMFDMMIKPDEKWNECSIGRHFNEMITILLEDLD